MSAIDIVQMSHRNIAECGPDCPYCRIEELEAELEREKAAHFRCIKTCSFIQNNYEKVEATIQRVREWLLRDGYEEWEIDAELEPTEDGE